MSSLLDAVNVSADKSSTDVGNNTMSVIPQLLVKPGDAFIMTLEQAYNILGDLGNGRKSRINAHPGYNTSTYYMYAINDTFGDNDAVLASTPAHLQAVGLSWYQQLNKPTTEDNHWYAGNHEVFGGPLNYVGCDYPNYYFNWFYSAGIAESSCSRRYWDHCVPGSVYVVVVRAENTIACTSSLPIVTGDVSIMNLEQAYKALGGSTSLKGTQCDPTEGYDSSTYHVYAINDTAGKNDSKANSTYENLLEIDLDWYNELYKPTTGDNHWTIGDHKMFGGPLVDIYYDGNSTYSFRWYYSDSLASFSDIDYYWNDHVSGSVCVAVVRAK